MFATNLFEQNILNVFRNTAATGVAQLYCGLYISSPTDTGLAGTEVSYSGYTRLAMSFTAPNIEAGNYSMRNLEDLLYAPAPTAIGTIGYIGISDSATAGNMLLYGDISVPLTIAANQQPSIYAGDILYYIVSDFSAAFEQSVLNVLRNQTLSGFTPYLALFNGDPEGTGIELSGDGYGRPSVTFGAPAVQTGGYSQIENTALVRFPSPVSPWGLWAYDGIMDAATGGNLIAKYQNPIPETIQKNYVPQVLPGDYKIAMN